MIQNSARRPPTQRVYAKFLCILLFTNFFGLSIKAQLINRGKISFERKTNQHLLMSAHKMDQEVIQRVPKFATSYYELYFNQKMSFYAPSNSSSEHEYVFGGIIGVENIIQTSFDEAFRITQKTVFNETYLIRDTLPSAKWKISNEARMIAGFQCKTAYSTIFDTIHVIAFFSDAIVPIGGPESFCNLPGMILGVAIPKLHTTWYAKAIDTSLWDQSKMRIPNSGKKMTSKDFVDLISRKLDGFNEIIRSSKWEILL